MVKNEQPKQIIAKMKNFSFIECDSKKCPVYRIENVTVRHDYVKFFFFFDLTTSDILTTSISLQTTIACNFFKSQVRKQPMTDVISII